MSLVLAEQGVDATVGDVLPSVKALRVAGQQDLNAVAGALGDLSRVDPGIEPRRQRRVPEIVRPTRERRGGDGRRERQESSLLPHAVVGRGRDDRALLTVEESPVFRRAERVQVLAQHGDELGGPAVPRDTLRSGAAGSRRCCRHARSPLSGRPWRNSGASAGVTRRRRADGGDDEEHCGAGNSPSHAWQNRRHNDG